ncbi:MAG: HIT domain-containing protein [Nanoarchaeota archaeon]
MKECLFCSIDKIKEDILWGSGNFYVKVGVGVLAPGHVMLLPKKHLNCFAQLPKQLREEFVSVKDKLYNKIKYVFNEPIIYEQGVYGQSIKHAHLHFLPFKNNYYNLRNVKENIFKSLKSTKIDEMSKITDVFKNEGSYFYLEQNGRKWVIHTKDQEEGKFTFRKEFARLTGMHALEAWQTMPKSEKQRNIEWVNITKGALKNEE